MKEYHPHSILISYGSGPEGHHEVRVGITAAEAMLMLSYLLTAPRNSEATPFVWMSLDYPLIEQGDGGGGEALVVPSASDSLAEMTVIGGVQ